MNRQDFHRQVTIQCHNCCDMWDSQGRIKSTCWYWMTTKFIIISYFDSDLCFPGDCQ